jgi:hypothetical protein
MIAFIRPLPSRRSASNANDKFLMMLPSIRDQARLAFRAVQPELKEELVAEVVANAYVAFSRLVERGRADLAYPTPLAQFAIRQVRCGRRVGSKLNIRAVSSRHAQLAKGIVMERLDKFDAEEGEWREALVVEDRKAGPAETAAARIDVAAWFRSLARKKRRIAQTLARGEGTVKVAAMFGLTAGRISQLRQELAESWAEYQGELAFA